MPREEIKKKYPDISEEVAIAYLKGWIGALHKLKVAPEVTSSHIHSAVTEGDELLYVGFLYRAQELAV